jgi:hypothetical protein
MTTQEAIVAHRRADGDYDGLSCDGITPRLLRGDGLTDGQRELVDAMDSGFADCTPANSEFIVFRGGHRAMIESIQKNPCGRYLSYAATSRDIGEALRFLTFGSDSVLLRIICPAGSRYLEISDPALATLERHEVLLPRGQRFFVEPWDIATLPLELTFQLRLTPASAYWQLTAIPDA